MPAFLKDLIVITPILVGAAYGIMRLVVWLLTDNGRRPKWSGKFARLFIWSVAMSILSLAAVFITAVSFDIEDLTIGILFNGIVYFGVLALFFYFFRDAGEKKYETRAVWPEHRGPWFFLAVAAELFLIPLITLALCREYGYYVPRALLGWMPVALALSSLLVNITVAASNFKHKLDMRSPWSKGALIFAAAVAFIYPVCHGAAFAIDEEHHWMDLISLLFWAGISAAIVDLISVYTLSFFYALMDDAEDYKMLVPSLFDDINDIPSYNDSNDSYEAPKYKPMNLYRSSYDDPDPAREEIFREYDESRRRSEDIQQFHRAHPDADLSDHYSWEDILDAETDGYLEDDD